MPKPADWVPVRFPAHAGPEWLSLLAGTLFNTVVIGDAAAAKPLIDAARAQGFAIASTKETPQPVVAVPDVVWPHVRLQQRGGEAGPTGSPWLDSNGWRIQLWQARLPGWIVWPLAEAPADTVLRPEHYLIAIADAAMYGARWPLTVREALRINAADWKRLCDAVAFFEARRNDGFRPVAKLGICSTFQGPNQDLAEETLNLASRRLLPYRVIDRKKLAPDQLDGLQAVLWLEEQGPSGPAAEALPKFVKSGGLLIVPASLAHVSGGLKPAARQRDGYAVFTSGAGTVAVARKPWTDPFLLAEDAHMLLSRKHDVIRLWNAGVVTVRYSEAAAGHGRAELVNFAGRPFGHPMSLWVAKQYRTGRLTILGETEPRPLALTRRHDGTELHLPPFDVYAAVDLES
ncbi:MAG TPA: hypothetical protein VFL57_20815 [Bryobacteraceae bacterium]|nr:hypothetical protein [Bryobacteraceae bacterium]